MKNIKFDKVTMEKFNEAVNDLVEKTYETVIEKDEYYGEIEQKKQEIIENLKSQLSEDGQSQIDKLIECFDDQIFLTARGFTFIRVLDIEKLEQKIEKK
ncbi:MAG: hypothetical protein FWD71_11270 [Oscillospiraceae bacterium]|nr:hypothetical protein [Oscillospiraceae bacterium]